jgi:fructose-1,6-bisphosphatase I
MDISTFMEQKAVPQALQNVINTLLETSIQVKEHMQEYNKQKTETQNASGDTQMALDKQADVIFFNALQKQNIIKDFASEERENIETVNPEAEYSIAMDPLDGSSLIDVNLAVATIIGIHKGPITTEQRNIVAAICVVFGPRTTIIFSPGKEKGTHEFIFRKNKFELVEENIMCKEKGKIYALGAKRNIWLGKHSKFIERIESEGYALRSSGCCGIDVSHILLKKGGIFAYPRTEQYPEGKLRILYELEPLTFLLNEANAKGTNGKQTLINFPITNIHGRAPAYLGSKFEVELANQILNE